MVESREKMSLPDLPWLLGDGHLKYRRPRSSYYSSRLLLPRLPPVRRRPSHSSASPTPSTHAGRRGGTAIALSLLGSCESSASVVPAHTSSCLLRMRQEGGASERGDARVHDGLAGSFDPAG